MSDLFFDVNLRGDLRRLRRRIACLFAGFSARLRTTRIGGFFASGSSRTDDDCAAQRSEGAADRR